MYEQVMALQLVACLAVLGSSGGPDRVGFSPSWSDRPA